MQNLVGPRARPVPIAVSPRVKPPRILVLEDQSEIRSLITAMLKIRGFGCDSAGTLAEARTLVAQITYDMLFLDVNLPDGSGLSLAEESTTSPLVVVITGCNDIQTAVQAIRDGAIDFITKPFTVGDFLQRLDRAMEEWKSRTNMRYYARALENLVVLKANELSQTSRQLNEVRDSTVAALGAALNLKDHETSDHCRRVSENSVRMGEELSLSAFELQNLKWGAYLHDVGKIGVPEHILLKPMELTKEERAVVERHPVMGWTMLQGIDFLGYATDVILSHHEKFDGTGYPKKLSGTDIPLHARIFAVMDALDAMTSERLYRPPLPFAEACRCLEHEAGAQFDPEILEIFLRASESTWLIQNRMQAIA
jgi:response regulator RpfG family c-di-GMP phosphodiesterase